MACTHHRRLLDRILRRDGTPRRTSRRGCQRVRILHLVDSPRELRVRVPRGRTRPHQHAGKSLCPRLASLSPDHRCYRCAVTHRSLGSVSDQSLTRAALSARDSRDLPLVGEVQCHPHDDPTQLRHMADPPNCGLSVGQGLRSRSNVVGASGGVHAGVDHAHVALPGGVLPSAGHSGNVDHTVGGGRGDSGSMDVVRRVDWACPVYPTVRSTRGGSAHCGRTISKPFTAHIWRIGIGRRDRCPNGRRDVGPSTPYNPDWVEPRWKSRFRNWGNRPLGASRGGRSTLHCRSAHSDCCQRGLGMVVRPPVGSGQPKSCAPYGTTRRLTRPSTRL